MNFNNWWFKFIKKKMYLLLCTVCSARQSDCSVEDCLRYIFLKWTTYSAFFKVQWKLMLLNYCPVWLLWKHIWLITKSDLVALKQSFKNSVWKSKREVKLTFLNTVWTAVNYIIFNAFNTIYICSVKKSETHLIGSMVSFAKSCSGHDVSEENIVRHHCCGNIPQQHCCCGIFSHSTCGFCFFR